MESTEFKINDYLSLELWGGKTFIYVNGKKFTHCKYVLLNIPVGDFDHYSSIKSIDEIMDNLDHSLEDYPRTIPPEVEFWAHCSNLQAWEEYGYNTDLLDSALSFPLLKKLTQEGDPQAKRAFKEEIAKRLIRGDLNNVRYLVEEGYSEFLTSDEIISIISSEDCPIFENIFNALKYRDSEILSYIDSLYADISKYLFSSIKKKLKQILDTNNLEDLYTLFNWQMLDVLSEKEILSLFDPPMNLMEKSIKILNKINYDEIKIEEYGLFSEKIEKILGDKIKEKLLNVIHKGNIKYLVLWRLNALKYLEGANTDYLNYLK